MKNGAEGIWSPAVVFGFKVFSRQLLCCLRHNMFVVSKN
jgi:hypothetical protein